MAIFEINKQYPATDDTTLFQINIIKDMQGNDVSHLIDSELQFHNHSEVKRHLAQKMNLPVDEIYVLEI